MRDGMKLATIGLAACLIMTTFAFSAAALAERSIQTVETVPVERVTPTESKPIDSEPAPSQEDVPASTTPIEEEPPSDDDDDDVSDETTATQPDPEAEKALEINGPDEVKENQEFQLRISVGDDLISEVAITVGWLRGVFYTDRNGSVNITAPEVEEEIEKFIIKATKEGFTDAEKGICVLNDEGIADDEEEPSPSIIGDVDGDGKVTVSDAVFIIDYVFVPGSPAPDPLCKGNLNSDEYVDISDAVYLINYIFGRGSEPIDNC